MNMTRTEKILSLSRKVDCIIFSLRRRLPLGVSYKDLYAPAWIGAIQAVDRLDSSLDNSSFNSFAETRIRGSITDYMRQIDPLKRGHRHAIKMGEENSVFSVPLKISIVEPCNLNTDSIDLKIILGKAKLNFREKFVICRYFLEEVSMKDIGLQLGINESRVSQIAKTGIRKCKVAVGIE